jgi:glucan biosynthesis protein C
VDTSISHRRYDLDWLRVLVILLVFIFHTGRFFDTMDWHVKNSTTYQGVQAWTMFLASWMMTLIFVISGASIYFALVKVSKLIKDKALRLLVPLGVGVFTHVSLAVYLERLTHLQFSGSFIQFLPHYFQGWYGDGGNFAWMGLHLWYLLVLFVFSLLFLPLFYLLKGPGQKALQWLGDVFSWPGMVYLLAIPVVWLAIGISPRSDLGDRNWGGWSLLGYMPFFFYGFWIISHEGLQKTIQRWRWVSFGLALAAATSMITTGLRYGNSPFGSRGYNLFNGIFGLNAWLWVLVALGFAFKYLQFN